MSKRKSSSKSQTPKIFTTSGVGVSILVPIDFSTESINALSYAKAYAEVLKAKLTLIHVVEPVATPDFYTGFPIALDQTVIKKKSVADLKAIAHRHNLQANCVVRFGRAFNEIAEEASQYDLIIISTHGYTGLKHAFIGSTAERVVRHAPCPVLVVRSPVVKVKRASSHN